MDLLQLSVLGFCLFASEGSFSSLMGLPLDRRARSQRLFVLADCYRNFFFSVFGAHPLGSRFPFAKRTPVDVGFPALRVSTGCCF